MTEQTQKKRKITCLIRGNDDDLELMEQARNKEFLHRRQEAIKDIKLYVSTKFYDGPIPGLPAHIAQIEKRIKSLKDVLLRGADEIDFVSVDPVDE